MCTQFDIAISHHLELSHFKLNSFKKKKYSKSLYIYFYCLKYAVSYSGRFILRRGIRYCGLSKLARNTHYRQINRSSRTECKTSILDEHTKVDLFFRNMTRKCSFYIDARFEINRLFLNARIQYTSRTVWKYARNKISFSITAIEQQNWSEF